MKTETINLMLLGGARRVSLAQFFKTSGKRIGYEVNIVSYDLSKDVPVSLEATVVEGLRWDNPDIIEDIIRNVRKYDIKIILPIVNGAIEIASRCKEKLPEVFIPVTSEDVAHQLFDKQEASRLFKDAGFPIPRTYSVLSARMPAIVKPRKGGSSKGIKIFTDMDDLMHLNNLQDYIIQEFIENHREYTVDCYIDDKGRILVTVPRERLEIMGGESTRSLTCRNETLEQLSRKIIERFNLRGPVNLQFLHDLDADRFLLLEVNPRLGGAVICSILAGAPITDYILNEALGNPLSPCDDWRPGTLMARYFKEAVFYKE